MDWLILICVLFVVFYLAVKLTPSNNNNPEETKINQQHSEDYDKIIKNTTKPHREKDCDYYYCRGYSNIWLKKRKGFKKFELVGMNYRDLDYSDMGEFEGEAVAETDNKYDDYAIAIYADDGVHLGYIPRGNKELHGYIVEEGGSVEAYGYASCDENLEYFIGEVGIRIE